MRVLQIGNFEPPHSTENELRDALERLGHEVAPLQEQHEDLWLGARKMLADREVDMVLWTSTRGLAAKVPEQTQRDLLATARDYEIPTVGYHLDRWWGLH